MITLTVQGSFEKATKYLGRLAKLKVKHIMEEYGKKGVAALAAATPKDTGKTSESWGYKIDESEGFARLSWYNTNDNDGRFNVAIGLQYGHGTGTGGWVEGIDYINPAIQPIFEEYKEAIIQEVTKHV